MIILYTINLSPILYGNCQSFDQIKKTQDHPRQCLKLFNSSFVFLFKCLKVSKGNNCKDSYLEWHWHSGLSENPKKNFCNWKSDRPRLICFKNVLPSLLPQEKCLRLYKMEIFKNWTSWTFNCFDKSFHSFKLIRNKLGLSCDKLI